MEVWLGRNARGHVLAADVASPGLGIGGYQAEHLRPHRHPDVGGGAEEFVSSCWEGQPLETSVGSWRCRAMACHHGAEPCWHRFASRGNRRVVLSKLIAYIPAPCVSEWGKMVRPEVFGKLLRPWRQSALTALAPKGHGSKIGDLAGAPAAVGTTHCKIQAENVVLVYKSD